MKVNKLKLYCLNCGKQTRVKIDVDRSMLPTKFKDKNYYCKRCGNLIKSEQI